MTVTAEQIADFYAGAQLTRIDFKYEHLEISGKQFKALAKAVRDGRVTVKFGDTGSMGAAYTPRKNLMSLKGDNLMNTRAGRAAVVHEGVHAIVDMSKAKGLMVVDDEAVAYIADTIYMANAGMNSVNTDAASQRIYDATYALVDKFKLRYKKGRKIHKKHCKALIDAIAQHPHYGAALVKQKLVNDGI